MTDREHTAVNHAQHTTRDSAIDCRMRGATFDQLMPTDNSVLTLRQSSDQAVTELRGDFAVPGAANSTRTGHGPSLAPKSLRVTRGVWRFL